MSRGCGYCGRYGHYRDECPYEIDDYGFEAERLAEAELPTLIADDEHRHERETVWEEMRRGDE